MSRIFISYKRVDKDKVFRIKDQIESSLGEKCWIDLDGIESDAQFKNVIIKAINECEIVLFMYSKAHSKIVDFEKDWTVRELNFAQKRGKRIVFVNLDRSVLSDIFEFDYGTKQQVDGLSKESLNHLCEDLSKWLGINSQEVSTHNETSSNEAEMAKQIEQVSASNKDNDADDGCFVSSLITPYRNKLFSYSRTAAFSVAFLLVIWIALVFVDGSVFPVFIYKFINCLLSVVYCALWVALFALIRQGSDKNSPHMKPSFIIVTGYGLSIVTIVIKMIKILFSVPIGILIANVLDVVSTAVVVIGFIWISKFFAKGSSLKLASIIIPIVLVINYLLAILLPPPYDFEAVRVRSIINLVFTYCSGFFFMFSLSKLGK